MAQTALPWLPNGVHPQWSLSAWITCRPRPSSPASPGCRKDGARSLGSVTTHMNEPASLSSQSHSLAAASCAPRCAWSAQPCLTALASSSLTMISASALSASSPQDARVRRVKDRALPAASGEGFSGQPVTAGDCDSAGQEASAAADVIAGSLFPGNGADAMSFARSYGHFI